LRLVVASVSVDIDPRSGETILSIRLDEDSRRRFAQFSVANLGQVIDIRIDGKSVTKPVIRDPIVGGIFLVPIKQPAEARQLAAHLTDRTAALEMEAVPK